MKPTPDTLYRYLSRYAQGRKNAMKSAVLENHFSCGDRYLRSLIPLVEEEYGIAVLASYDPENGGYYIPISREEGIEGARELDAHAKNEIAHSNRKRKLLETMFGELEQMTLGV